MQLIINQQEQLIINQQEHLKAVIQRKHWLTVKIKGFNACFYIPSIGLFSLYIHVIYKYEVKLF